MMGPMGKTLGLGSAPSPGVEEEKTEYASPMAEEEPASELPAGFDSAFAEFQEAPTAQGLYDLIEMCKSGGESKPSGLALILGGKGKKP